MAVTWNEMMWTDDDKHNRQEAEADDGQESWKRRRTKGRMFSGSLRVSLALLLLLQNRPLWTFTEAAAADSSDCEEIKIGDLIV